MKIIWFLKFLTAFRRQKEKKEEKKKEKKVEVVRQPSELELICGEDREVYEALSNTLLLKPPSKDFSIEGALEEARQKERVKDFLGAGRCYFFAGRLSLFNGDVEGVKKYFRLCQELTGKNYLILKVPEKAVEKAQAYYKSLKTK